MFVKSTVAIALLASFVAAQTNTTIDPNNIDLSTRSSWCGGEINTCGTLCGGETDSNGCDPATLDFNCTCTSNGSTPGLQYYTQTLPTFICEEIFSECNAAGVGNSAAQKKCKENRDANCGTLNPDNYTAPPTSSSSSSATSSPTPSNSAAAGTAAPSSSSTGGAAVPTMAVVQKIGSSVLAAGAAAAFGLML